MSTTEPTPELTPDQIRAQIERTRAELAETVDALAAKADVKGQAKDKVHEVTDSVKEKAADLAGTVKEKATDLAGTVKGRATDLKDRAADAIPHPGGHETAPGGPATTDETTVVITDTRVGDDTAALGVAGTGGSASRHRAPGDASLGPIGSTSGTSSTIGASGDDDAPGAVSQVKEKVTAAAGSVAAAASGAAADVKARVSGATGHGGTDATTSAGHPVAPAQRSTATTAGAVAAVLAVLAVVVIVRKRKAAGA